MLFEEMLATACVLLLAIVTLTTALNNRKDYTPRVHEEPDA